MENIKGLKRTDYCGKLRLEDVGRTVTLFGWAQRQRDLGNLIFIDLRDKTGIVQISTIRPTEAFLKKHSLSVRNMCLLLKVLSKSVKAKTWKYQQEK